MFSTQEGIGGGSGVEGRMPIEYCWTCDTRRAKPGDVILDSGRAVEFIGNIKIRVELDRLREHVIPVV
jgi:hypothetical protein